jgi:hypothetical protein
MTAMTRPTRRLAALGLAAALLLGGCRGAPDGPDAQVRALVRDAVAAAERKDVGALRAMVSERYADDQGQDKRAIEALLRLHFLRNQSVHLYARVRSVTLAPPDRAQASVLVAMAGVPISSGEQLPGLRADLHRFELELAREDGTWRVQRAAWQRAEAGEFLNP